MNACASPSSHRQSDRNDQGLDDDADASEQSIGSGSCIEVRGRGRAIPFVNGVSPVEGSGLGGTDVTITGEGFKNGASVELGGSPCYDVKVLNPQTLTCLSGTHRGGTADVLVINPNRHCGRLAKAFSYVPNVVIEPKNKTVAVGNTVAYAARYGRPPYNYAIISGGGVIDGNGLFKAPDTPGSTVVRVTDAMNTISDSVITINAPLKIVTKPAGSKDAGVGGFDFDVIGGAPPITYTVEKTAASDATGDESAKVTVVKVVDSAGNEARIALKVNRVTPLVLYPAIVHAVPGDKVNFIASGGYPPYTFQLSEGKGKLNAATGVYHAPMEAGQDTIKVTDSQGNAMDASVTISAESFGQSRLALGYGHSCALVRNTVKCWGDNRFGQLGNGSMVNKRLPVPVQGLEGAALSIAAGHNFTCVLMAGGTIKCWGENRYGQLGDGSDINSVFPQQVSGLHSGVIALTAGQYHACGIVRGATYCWGSNRRGQLGNGSLKQSGIPVPVKGLGEGVQSVAAGAAHTCALTKEGGVKCWGYNYAGQLGDGTTADRLEPVQVKGLETGVKSIHVGGYHSCALMADGSLKCWGANGMGQLGKSDGQNSFVPIDVEYFSGGKKLQSVATGFFHTCGWDGEQVMCWGYNRSGQLGISEQNPSLAKPNVVPGLKDVIGIAVGVNHSCALQVTGVSCWGDNSLGQFGNRSMVSQITPGRPAELHE